ncbi:unnamed protein product [Rotaria sp. Silwood1]|nr:unnamed protein product [Rotaria sp. Silwood1]CAF1146139.1 unnamed protein product [Rotaria sp. Silwood1]CAF3487356.1 unnamed protein product [Rotaria sp. Silwood1]CAF4647045.1 unnamed protein product [Rotaria sp. Silwood1]CAF4743127.1 unnamed protein product [Rotaria sp. Silwood1]
MSDATNYENLLVDSPTKYQNNHNDLSISKQTFCNGYEYTKITNNNTLSEQRKLILHFDNRNTLQVANNVSATTIEQGVNNFLTGVLWGYENDKGEWEWVSTSPSLHKPNDCPNCTTYFKYLESLIVREASGRKDLRAKTGSFINNEGARFRRFYDELIESLRYNRLGLPEREREDLILTIEEAQEHNTNELKPSVEHYQRRRRLSILHKDLVPVNGFRSANGTLYHYILPSFFRLIQYLQETNRDFVIYLRTMGDDSKNFLENAERVLANEHPSFQFNQPLHVNLQPGRIERSKKDQSILLHMKFEEDSDMQIIADEFLIHEKLESGHGIHAIRDDFNAWFQTNYHYTTSKPIWFDPDDRNPRSHHILFDDNFRVIDPNDSIVDIRIMNRQKHKCYSCPFEFYPELENVFAVQANLYLILADQDYYIKTIAECEKRLDQLLQDTETLEKIKKESCIDHA